MRLLRHRNSPHRLLPAAATLPPSPTRSGVGLEEGQEQSNTDLSEVSRALFEFAQSIIIFRLCFLYLQEDFLT